MESQRPEIYAVPYPGPGGKVQISPNGGQTPRWRGDGKEIFYSALDGRLMAAEIKANASSLEVGRVQPLFGGLLAPAAYAALYDVSLDGQRFLVQMQTEAPGVEPITLVQNWATALKR